MIKQTFSIRLFFHFSFHFVYGFQPLAQQCLICLPTTALAQFSRINGINL